MKQNLRALLMKETSGQATLEMALFLTFMVLFVVWTINVNYFVGFMQTIHAGGEQSVNFSTQGTLTALGTTPSSAAVTTVAKNEVANTGRDSKEATPTINLCSTQIGVSGGVTQCSAGGTGDFTDPESSASSNTGQFYANSVQITQKFTPFMAGTIFGHQFVPFSAPQSFSHTVYMRSLN